MKSIFNFIVRPADGRTNNVKKVGGKELILNSELQDHRFVSRRAVVVSVPSSLLGDTTDVQPGDEVIVHHNVFRRFKNIRGEEVNSKSFYKEDLYFCYPDQVYLYKSKGEWKGLKDYCFVKPIKETGAFSAEKERPLIGILKYADPTLPVKEGDLVGFTPNSEYEFIVEGERLYRVRSQSISIKYEYQGDEEEYNPGWAQGG